MQLMYKTIKNIFYLKWNFYNACIYGVCNFNNTSKAKINTCNGNLHCHYINIVLWLNYVTVLVKYQYYYTCFEVFLLFLLWIEEVLRNQMSQVFAFAFLDLPFPLLLSCCRYLTESSSPCSQCRHLPVDRYSLLKFWKIINKHGWGFGNSKRIVRYIKLINTNFGYNFNMVPILTFLYCFPQSSLLDFLPSSQASPFLEPLLSLVVAGKHWLIRCSLRVAYL